ncbi:hypothetical protein [Chryseobacterium sp. CFS15]|uniref:hypothetical protein n=1 Tax=Chryseobacterium sp. CFS15 TaxID=2986946 RepID=UPI0028092483|nr:hypothetical protein [Chryseobacterium sp. CFS15]MDQ8140516.1 hypothetical protein [Chryseobacterium sp. CFS15]
MNIIKRSKHISRHILIFSIFLSFFTCQAQYKDQIDKCLIITGGNSIDFTFQDLKLNNEVQDFYKSKNKYDIIVIKDKSGDLNYSFKRWKKSEDLWEYKEVTNGKISSVKKVEINEMDVVNLFSDFEPIGVLNICNNCFDCNRYIGLIKKDNDLFFYQLNENIENQNDQRLINYQKIFKYFNNLPEVAY